MDQAQATPEGTGSLLDRMLDPLSRCLDDDSARNLLALQVAPSVQGRVDELAALANEGRPTAAERLEYEAYINADDFIAILQLKARRQLATGDAA